MTDGLAGFRRRIDECDAQIVHWINERLKVCQEVGRFKVEHGMRVRVPEREEEVIARALGRNQGPCSPETLEKLFRILIETAVVLEQQQGEDRPKGKP